VRDFLAHTVALLPPREAYLARVAGNAIGIVQRELAPHNPDALAGHGGADAICAGLRDGTLRVDDAALLAALTTDAMARLAVDNPRYATLARLQDKTRAVIPEDTDEHS
jgi:hypothetical protein